MYDLISTMDHFLFHMMSIIVFALTTKEVFSTQWSPIAVVVIKPGTRRGEDGKAKPDTQSLKSCTKVNYKCQCLVIPGNGLA